MKDQDFRIDFYLDQFLEEMKQNCPIILNTKKKTRYLCGEKIKILEDHLGDLTNQWNLFFLIYYKIKLIFQWIHFSLLKSFQFVDRLNEHIWRNLIDLIFLIILQDYSHFHFYSFHFHPIDELIQRYVDHLKYHQHFFNKRCLFISNKLLSV